MAKLAHAHKTAIIKLMLHTTAAYITRFVTDDSGLGFGMYADDVAYNSKALAKFNKTGDCVALHDAVMSQDTLVREYYISVLRYIEDNALIPAAYYACS